MAVADTPPVTIFISGKNQLANDDAMITLVHGHRGPATTSVTLGDAGLRELLGRYLPAVNHMAAVSGSTTAYVCIGTNCQAPETDPARVAALLTANRRRSM